MPESLRVGMRVRVRSAQGLCAPEGLSDGWDVSPSEGGTSDPGWDFWGPDAFPRETVHRDDGCADGRAGHRAGRKALPARPSFSVLETRGRT